MFYVRERRLSNSRERLTRAIQRVSQQHEPACGQRLCSLTKLRKLPHFPQDPRAVLLGPHMTTVSFVITKTQLVIQGSEPVHRGQCLFRSRPSIAEPTN
jgi:hypothetical protein